MPNTSMFDAQYIYDCSQNWSKLGLNLAQNPYLMDSQAQDGNLCRWGVHVGVDFGGQNDPKIVFVRASKSKLISKAN